MLVGCKHPNGNGGKTATTTRVNKQEEPNFEEFVKNFCSDSCFQISHISGLLKRQLEAYVGIKGRGAKGKGEGS